MDEMVLKAMAKWPNVPACRGWLGLDARGDWYMRDDAAQQAGPFSGEQASTSSKGSKLQHRALIDFIGRNYASDEWGQWYFQNGPQRVYVELSDAPWVARVDVQGHFTSHTGIDLNVDEVLMDEKGKAYVLTTRGLAVVHSMDMLHLASWLERQVASVKEVDSVDLPLRFGFCLSPARNQT